MTINDSLEALEEKFENDNNEQEFVDGILDIVYSEDFVTEVFNKNVSSDSIFFSWREDYDPHKDEYGDEYIDLDKDAFDYRGISAKNKKLVNDAIRDELKSAIEDWEEQAYMYSHPYSY